MANAWESDCDCTGGRSLGLTAVIRFGMAVFPGALLFCWANKYSRYDRQTERKRGRTED